MTETVKEIMKGIVGMAKKVGVGDAFFRNRTKYHVFFSLYLFFPLFAIFLLRENYSLESQQCALCVLLITVVKMRTMGDGVSL